MTPPPPRTTPANSTPLDGHIGFWMRFVSDHVSARFEKRLREKDVSVTEWVALRLLYDGETTSHTSLIEALGMTRGAASKILTRLENKGLVERRYAEGSAKAQLLALTAKGRLLVPKLAMAADENDAYYFGHLAPETRSILVELLREIVDTHRLKNIPLT